MTQQALGTLTHLARSLVGERDREDLAGTRLVAVDQIGDAVCQDAGLARSGAGQHKQRALTVQHRGALLVVEALKEVDGASSAHGLCGHPFRIGAAAVVACFYRTILNFAVETLDLLPAASFAVTSTR